MSASPPPGGTLTTGGGLVGRGVAAVGCGAGAGSGTAREDGFAAWVSASVGAYTRIASTKFPEKRTRSGLSSITRPIQFPVSGPNTLASSDAFVLLSGKRGAQRWNFKTIFCCARSPWPRISTLAPSIVTRRTCPSSCSARRKED